MGWEKISDNTGTYHLHLFPRGSTTSPGAASRNIKGNSVDIAYSLRRAHWEKPEVNIPIRENEKRVTSLHAILLSVDNPTPHWYLENLRGKIEDQDFPTLPLLRRYRDPGIGITLKLLSGVTPLYLDYEVSQGTNSHIACGGSEEYSPGGFWTPEVIPHLKDLADSIEEGNEIWAAIAAVTD